MTEREIRILKHVPLSKMIAKVYLQPGSTTQLEDLRQEALVGLIEAVDEFPAAEAKTPGLKFEGFAYNRMRRRIEGLASAEGGGLSMCSRTMYKRSKVMRKAQALKQATGYQPTREELSKATGVSERSLEEYAYLSRGLLNETADDLDTTVLDRLPAEAPDTSTTSVDLEKLTAAVEALPPRQRNILERRYGMNGHEEQSLETIAKSLGCSKQNVHVHEQKGMEALRRALVS